MLSLSTDEFDELEDEKTLVEGLPFIAEEMFLSQHGNTYEIVFNGKTLELLVPGQAASEVTLCSTKS